MAPTFLAFLLVASNPSAVAEAPKAAAKPERICRDSEVSLGSHMRTGRRCMTAEEWLQEDFRKGHTPVNMTITGEQGDGQPRQTRPQ